MNRDKNLPLTETTYYVLLALLEPAHGYLIMQKVEELSNHQVKSQRVHCMVRLKIY